MKDRIERLFRVPHRILEAVRQALEKKKMLGIIHKFTKEELFSQIDQADSAMEKAKADFEIGVENDSESPELLLMFRQAHFDYFRKSSDLRGLVHSRVDSAADFIASISFS